MGVPCGCFVLAWSVLWLMKKGHKELLAIEGAAGLKPCISCMNAVNLIHKAGYADGQYTVGLDC
eukprot:8370099-Pyramimonas_sp.AAC.1